MATRTVASGQTFALHGTLGHAHTLVADSGSPSDLAGAYIAVHDSALNHGTIALLAGPASPNLDGATGATLRVTGTLTNTGRITAAGGIGGFGDTGAVGGASVQIADTGALLNTGAIWLAGATRYDNHHGQTTGANLRDNGTLTNDGSLLISGSSIASTAAGATAAIGGLLTNAGRIEVESSYSAYGSRGGVLRVLPTGTLVNTGHIEVRSDPRILYARVGVATLQIGGQLINDGVLGIYNSFSVRGLGAQTVINSTGTVVNAGLIQISAGFSYHGDYSFYATPATLTNQGVLTNLGTLDISGVGIDSGVVTNAGTINLAGGSASQYESFFPGGLTVSGTLTNAGTMVAGGGTSSRYASAYGFGAVVSDTGTVDNPGLMTFGGASGSDSGAVRGATFAVAGVLTNSGTVLLGGGAAMRSYSDALGATLSDTGVIDNSGTIILQGSAGYPAGVTTGATLQISFALTNAGTHATTATVEISGTLTNLGTIDCYGPIATYGGVYGAGGVIAASGLLIDPGAITGTGTLGNTGILSSGAAGITTGLVDLKLVNTGTVEIAANGSFAINGRVSGDGQISIATGGVLTLAAGAGAAQTVDFAGTQSALAAPMAFYATIEGLRPGTTIDFLQTGLSAAVASGTTLDLTLAAGGTLDFKLAAPLAAGDMLVLQSDQHGGTDLTLSQSSDAVALGSGSYGLNGREAFSAQPSPAGVLLGHLVQPV
jgi:hypothetical protein